MTAKNLEMAIPLDAMEEERETAAELLLLPFPAKRRLALPVGRQP